MKKLILPLALCVTLFSGCSSNLLGQSADSQGTKPASQKTATTGATAKATTPINTVQTGGDTMKPTATSATSTESQTNGQPDSQQYIRLPNDQIDFNHLVIDCDVTQELITVKQGDKIVRTFPTSSGLDTIPDNTTPLGTFYIEPERGTWFYSDQYQEGAKYWVSWSGHGIFLFHSVVMDKNGNIKQDELKKLGTKASHGCFRIPLDDAKWIYDNIKVGTKVIVHK